MLTVTLYNDGAQTTAIELIDNLGRVLAVYEMPDKVGLVSVEIPTAVLASGLYYIRAGHHYGKAIID